MSDPVPSTYQQTQQCRLCKKGYGYFQFVLFGPGGSICIGCKTKLDSAYKSRFKYCLHSKNSKPCLECSDLCLSDLGFNL